MFAVWFNNLDPVIVRLGPVSLFWYGLSYVVSALLVFALYRRLAVRGYSPIPAEKVADFITYTGLFGVLLGGRVGWVLFYGVYLQHDSPWWWLDVRSGGMSSHGGILGIVAVTFFLSRKWNISWTGIGDSLCVAAPIGLFLVRCANFVNGELFGHPANVPWAVKFGSELRTNGEAAAALGIEPGVADSVLVAARQDPVLAQRVADVLPARHPSQLYEALLEGAVLFAILYPLRTRLRMPRGVITGLFFICYAVLRFVGEIFRVPDPAWQLAHMSAGQTLSLFMLGIGAAFIVWGRRARQYEAADC